MLPEDVQSVCPSDGPQSERRFCVWRKKCKSMEHEPKIEER